MIRIEIRDFQSIESVDLEVTGFTALVGRSNIGKSAVIRAVRAVLTNSQGVQDVRHGPTCIRRLRGVKTCKCKASVHLVGSGFDILWEKGDADSRYVVNGTIYEAVPRGTPDFLKPWFCPVKIGEKNTLLQVASQFDPLFLLEASGPAIADVLSDVAQLDRINVASRLVDKDRREALATIKVREKDIQRTQDELAEYVGLDGVVSRTEDLTTRSANVQITQKATEAVLRLLALHLEHSTAITVLEPVGSLACPIKQPVKKAVHTWEWLIGRCDSLDNRQRSVCNLGLVENVQVPDETALIKFVTATAWMLNWLGQLRAIKVVYSKLVPVCDVPLPDVTQLHSVAERVDGLLSLAQQFVRLSTLVREMEGEQDKIKQEEDAIRQELQVFKICPLCDQSLGGDA